MEAVRDSRCFKMDDDSHAATGVPRFQSWLLQMQVNVPAGESEGEASTSVSSPDSTAKSEQDNEAPSLPPKPVKELCLVLFPYAASNDDELNLKEGDVITLLSREVQDVGWWKGELRGKVGVFPDNFVEVIQHEEGPKKPDRPPSKSPLVTTNRTRDSITKPSLLKGDIGEATVKKPVTEAPSKTEEKTSPAPPILGKKPSLPIKKPNRASDPPSKPSSKPVDAVDGASHSRTSHLVPKSNSPSTRVGGIDTREDVAEFDSVERGAMLHHPTASRAKAPRRRPPTFNKDNEAPTKLMNGSAEERPPLLENHTLPEDGEEGIEEDEGGARRGRSWEREKNKPPWMEELKLNQARKSSSLSPTAKNSPGPLSPTLLSVGSGPTAGERRQPLPTSASRGKIDTTHGPGKLTSPQHPTTENDSIMENLTNNSRHSSVAAVRHHVVRPQSMYTGDNPNRPSPHARPLSVSTSPEQSRLLSELNRVILPTTSSPVLPSNIPTSKPDSTTSLSSLSEADMLGSPASSPFVSYKQFLELRDMASGKSTLIIPNQDSNPTLPVIGTLI
uniref:SH3 domain-containing protein n=1 Tax=Timema monikensis TaxID=170555 RepID=A0A7R9EGP7_9NEOP|nr:unnamed protein product [Timema monikensis]